MPVEPNGLWFLGTHVRVRLDGSETEGRLGAFDVMLPGGASPPLHSHPQDETFVVLAGQVTVWVVPLAELEGDGDGDWVSTHARVLSVGDVVCAPGGTPHSFRVESDTARVLTLSTPAGIEGFVRGMAEPAGWPWLPPPPDGPRVDAEEMARVEREHGMVRHGPPPPPRV